MHRGGNLNIYIFIYLIYMFNLTNNQRDNIILIMKRRVDIKSDLPRFNNIYRS